MNPYEITFTKIEQVRNEAPGIRSLTLRKKLKFLPGQFLMVSYLGVGECAISVSSYPKLEISFRGIGNVTKNLMKLKKNQKIGIRGPYGKPYPLEEILKKHVIIIGGGIGLAPLRSLIKFLISKKKYDISLFYGARTLELIPFKNDIKKWKKLFGVYLTVDKGNKKWKGKVGVVTDIMKKFRPPKNSIAVLCGPPVMFRFVSDILKKKGLEENDIIFSMERNMKCGIGKCGHCNIEGKFVCKDGPNFRMSELR